MKLLRALVGILGRGVALLVLLALLLPVAVILYTTTDDFRSRLLDYAVPELDRRMGGDLTVGGLEGSPLTALRLADVALAWRGDEIFRIPAATVAIDWSALLVGQLRIARIELASPRVLFKQHAEHGWDWRQALAPLVPAPDEHREPRPDPVPVVIEALSLEQGTLRIEALEHAPVELSGIDLRGRIDFSEKAIEVAHASLATGASKLTAQGGLDFAGHAELAIAVESLDPRDLASVSPELAKSLDFLAPARGALTLRGDKQALALAGELDWPEAKLVFDASGRVDRPLVAESKLEATLDVQDLRRFVRRSPIAGRLAAQLRLENGAGTLAARLRPGSARGGAPTTPGSLETKGRFRLVEVPEATLDFTAKDFDPAGTFPGHPEWTGALSGRGQLVARGRRRAELAASLALELAKSRVGTFRLDRGRLKATLAGDRIEVAELALESPIGRARVTGRASTSPSGALALKSRIDVADLGPLLALAKQRGEGSLTARVDLDGSLAKPRVAGEVAVTAFGLGEVRFERASLRARAAIDRDRKSFDGVLESLALVSPLGAWRLERAAKLRVDGDAVTLESAAFASDDARLRLEGRLGRTGRQDFVLEGRGLPIAEWARQIPERIPPDLLTHGVLDLDLAIGGTAAEPIVDLALHPRALALGDQAIDTVEARLRYATRLARAELHAATEPSLRLDAEAALPFALAWSTGFVAKPTGPLEATADGQADDLSLLEPFVARSVERLGGRARAHLELEGPLDALRPTGLVTASELTARPRRTGVTLVSGELAVELAADRFRIRRATATVAGHEDTARFRAEGEGPLPVFLTRIGRAPADPDAAIDDVASSADYTTKIEIEQWPLLETRRDQLFASGVMRAHGSFEAPHVEGKLEIVRGTLRPNIAFLSSGPPPRDPTIELEPDPALGEAGATGTNGGAAAAGRTLLSRFEALELAVDVDLGRDLWIKHEQAEVLLSGRVEARKRSAKPVTLDGRIEAQRGFADLQGRRFRLMEGALEFVAGPKIDPQLDVLGRYKAPAHTIDARLTGTASKPVLTLTSDPTLSQEDILAVLLFGRPASELSQQQQTSLGQRAEQMASAFGMTAVGRSLASAIGLEELGLQIEEISSTRAAIGAYVGRNIFVALAQEFSGERGQELSIEYEFLPGWSLVGSTTSQGTNAADLVWKIRY